MDARSSRPVVNAAKKVAVAGRSKHPRTKSSADPVPVAGVGASAGGLEAFAALLRALPAHIGMALVLIQHLDPTQQSMLADILGRASEMPVTEAVNGMLVEPDHVYVMPPNVTMRLSQGSLVLRKRSKPPAHVLPIDAFFRSLADECADQAIGIVLSGTGTDGALGLAAIKAAGGLTFAQDPSTAEYEGMPKASIESGAADAALSVDDIAAELIRLGGNARRRRTPELETLPHDVDEETLRKILALVRSATGLDLTSYRKTTLLRRVSRRMLLEGSDTMQDYLVALQNDPSKVEAFYRDVLVNMTEFFRDPDALEALKREAFPEIVERRAPTGPVRVWVPGCSKGQEAYSVLIALFEFLEEKGVHPDIQLFASDVNARDVEFARAGIYPQGIATTEVSAERLARFFVQVPSGYQIDRAIREMCVFAVHDVTSDPPFSKLDLVSFRNVLIYMERPLQKRVLQILHYALEPGGFLFLGSSETAGTDSALFQVVDKKHRLYKRKPGPARLLSAIAPSANKLDLDNRARAREPAVAFDVLAQADRIIQGSYQPSGVVVSADLDVLQFRGHMGPYLDPGEGQPEMKLPRLVAPGLALTVEAAIRDAAKRDGPAQRRGLVLESDGGRRSVDVQAVPIAAPTGESYYLVLFDERGRETPATETLGQGEGERSEDEDGSTRLRRELQQTREQLETLVSEREAANADLRTVNERFQTSNEELRTINEEFQTAQEELQSTNEELTTLNDELRSRNNELARLADDLNNVIEGVEIPILILDRDLRIRRFTPQAEAIVHIVSGDVGRPVTDLSLKVEVADLKNRARSVLEQGVPSEADVRTLDGHWYSMRIRPYTTTEGALDGVVVAFVDIDELKKAMRSADFAREHAEAIVETVREPLLTLGPNLTVLSANEAFYATFAVSAEETIGRPLSELDDGRWNIPELNTGLERILSGGEFADLEVDSDSPAAGRKIARLSARRVLEATEVPSILLAVDDVTIAASRQRLTTALNDIGATLASTVEFDAILASVLEDSSRALAAESAVMLLKQESTWLIKGAYALPEALVGRVLVGGEVPLAQHGLPTGEAVFLPDVSQDELFRSNIGIDPESQAVLQVPLMLRDSVLGSVSFHFHRRVSVFNEAEQDFARRLGVVLAFAFENAQLYAEQREIADTLQGALLTVPRHIPGVDFGYLYRSATRASAVGGDFFDLFELDNGRVGIVIGDVSGKGVRAATLTALVKNTIGALSYENDSPAVVVTKTNEVVIRATPASMFVTLSLCILDVASGHVAYCSAGHTTGLIKKAGGDIERLEVRSPMVGAFGSTAYVDGQTVIDVGDLLVLYTDGVTEARRGGDLFGEDRLVEKVRCLPPTKTRKVPQAIFKEVLAFTGGKLSDDVAILTVSRKGGA